MWIQHEREQDCNNCVGRVLLVYTLVGKEELVVSLILLRISSLQD